MKFLIVFACLLAVAFAVDNINVLRQDSEVNVDSFKTVLELDNHASQVAEGVQKGDELVVHGNFEWISPEGQKVAVSYVADENGYQPTGDVVPTPPPVPEAIIRAIKYIEAHPSKDNY